MNSQPALSPSLTQDLAADAWRFLQRTVLRNKWIPIVPWPKQAVFLSLPIREAFYGGAAGGGKSASLLAAALQFVDVPGYTALLLRRSFQDLALPKSLIDLANQWLQGTKAHWNGTEHRWTFPSGASLTFGYLQTELDKYRYQSAAFTFCGFDELSGFTESSYRYLFSRLRRLEGAGIPLRMRAASNPGGDGHGWVKARFIDAPVSPDRMFVPAQLEDNPSLDQAAYEATLSELDPVTYRQLRYGDWIIRRKGRMFKRQWFEIVDAAPQQAARCRFWDLAATTEEESDDPDWTVGTRMARTAGIYYVEDVRRGRWSPHESDGIIRQTAQIDTWHVRIRMEQEPGASGKIVVDDWLRKLAGYDFEAVSPTGAKVVRWRPMCVQAAAGNVKLCVGSWNEEWLNELCAVPAGGIHDDQADSAAGSFNDLSGSGRDEELGI